MDHQQRCSREPIKNSIQPERARGSFVIGRMAYMKSGNTKLSRAYGTRWGRGTIEAYEQLKKK